MPLTHRRARPLARDKQTFRDDRLFIIACDDTYAPKQYFDFFRIPRVQVHVVETIDGTSTALAVLERLLSYDHQDHDERWLLLDTDHCIDGPHIRSFLAALRAAEQHGIRVALSRPCFELWLLLHHADEANVTGLDDCGAVTTELRRALGAYSKTSLVAAHYPLTAISDACVRAKRLDRAAGGGDIPDRNTTRVFEIWRSICQNALSSQLPRELVELVRMLDDIA
jgi:RloB-like protein